MFQNGERIGTIDTNFLTRGQGTDVVTITLSPSARGVADPVNAAWVPQYGDRVTARGAVSGVKEGVIVDPTVTTRAALVDGRQYPIDTITARLSMRKGDSGAPVYHDGAVVALVHGGDLADMSVLALLDMF